MVCFSVLVNRQFNNIHTWVDVAVECIKTMKLAAVNDDER